MYWAKIRALNSYYVVKYTWLFSNRLFMSHIHVDIRIDYY